MIMVRRYPAVLPLALLMGLAASESHGQISERIDISIANVDVIVTDAKGNPVAGLTADDFELYEDGRKQAITNFAAPRERAQATASATGGGLQRPGVEPPPDTNDRTRLIVLFFDAIDIERPVREKFLDGVRTFFESTLRRGDVVTVLVWNRRVRVALPPTANRQQLYNALHALAFKPQWNETEFLRRTAEDRVNEAYRDAEFAAGAGMGDAIDPAAEESFQEFIQGEDRCANIKRKVRELKNVVGTIGRVDMQKVLIFASDDASTQPAPSCLLATEFESLADTANAHGVTIHGLHPAGGRVRMTGPDRGGFLPRTTSGAAGADEFARTMNEAGGLTLLANRTGGVSAMGAPQSALALTQAATQLRSYYSLGYKLAPGREDQRRKIRVTTKNASYRVKTRDAIVKMSDERQLTEAVATNLYLPQQQGVLSPTFNMNITGSKRAGRYRLIDVRLGIRTRDLMVIPGTEDKGKRSFSVLVSAGRNLGDASDVTSKAQEFEALNPSANQAVSYSLTVKVRPDTNRISIAVRDNTSGEVAIRLLGVPPEKK